MRKKLICDSSSLISLSMNCMLPLVVDMSEEVDFIITKTVYDEIITNPQRNRSHRMGPLKFKALYDQGILQLQEVDKKEVDQILDISNSIYYAKHKALRIIQAGEAEALALANDGNVLLMDERTLRFMVENPNDLMGLLEHRMHRGITMDRDRRQDFDGYCKGVKIIRSSELVAVAYEKGILQKYFSGEKRELLESCLWGLKSHGCSLAVDDVKEYLRMLA